MILLRLTDVLKHMGSISPTCFLEVRFFGSFGSLAVQTAQFLAVYGRRDYIGILGSNFLVGQGM
jgi:hypothetical protein